MFKFEKPVTPAEITLRMRELIDELLPQAEPEYIEVRPIQNAEADDCFRIVAEQVETYGGELKIGWALWEWPRIFVEAEFHCVWKRPDGATLDITPKADRTEAVLFLSDQSRPYENKQVDNIRRPIRKDPIVFRYLETFGAKFELLNRGERASEYGEIHLTGSEAREFNGIMSAQAYLYSQVLKLTPSATQYSPCPCGSGKKIPWCHGDAITKS